MQRKAYLLSVTLLLLTMLLSAGCAAEAAATQAPVATFTSAAAQAADATQAADAGQATAPAAAAVNPTAAPTLPPATQPANTQPAATEAVTAAVPATGSTAGLTFTLVPEQSEARYRITEQLANRNLPNDAVGATKQVSGSITVNPDGSIDTANSKFVVDVSSIASDNNRRDNYVRQNILQTSQYQYVTFVPTSVSGLSNPLPTSGPVNFQITGDMTIRDVTKPVTWTVTGTLENGTATGKAETAFKFADFNLPQPRVPIVLSLEDNIRLELDLTIQSTTP